MRQNLPGVGLARCFAYAILASLFLTHPVSAVPDYFPDEVGWRWDYVDGTFVASVENIATETVIGRETVVRRYLVNGLHVLDQFWSTDAEGNALLHAIYQPGFPRTFAYDEPIRFLQAPLAFGQVWEQTFDVYNDLEGAFFNTQATTLMIVATDGEISIPFGDVQAFGVDETRIGRWAEETPGMSITGFPAGPVARVQPKVWYSDGLGQMQFYWGVRLFRVSDITPGATPTEPATWSILKGRYLE